METKEAVGVVLLATLATAARGIAINTVIAWPSMLILGMINHSFDSRIPALGFFTVALLGVVARLLLLPLSLDKKD